MLKKLLFSLTVFLSVSLGLYAQEVVEISNDGTGTATIVPMNGLYVYSSSQVIYSKDLITETGNITQLAFRNNALNATSLGKLNGGLKIKMKVYMGLKDDNAFTSADDKLLDDALTLVYDGEYTPNAEGGWCEALEFQNPFYYDGSKNLVIAIVAGHDNTGTSYTASASYYAITFNTLVSETRNILVKYSDDGEELVTFNNALTWTPLSSARTPFVRLTFDAAGCKKVKDLKVNDLTATGAKLTWTGIDGSMGYLAEYRKAGTELWTKVPVSLNTYADLQLEEGTLYEVQVRNICADADTSNAAEISFQTPCNPVTLPIQDNFDSYAASIDYTQTAAIPCWIVSSAGAWPVISDDYAVSGDNSLMFNAANAYVILPPFNENLNTLQLKGKIRGTGTIQVGTMTDFNVKNTFTSYQSISGNSTEWSDFAVNFKNYEGEKVFVALKTTSSSAVYLDDVILTQRDACEPADAIAVANVTTNSADITITDPIATHTAWNVYYKTADAEEFTKVVKDTKTFTLDNLADNTTYQVYATVVCGEETESTPTATVSFTTELLIVPCANPSISSFPYVEDFENYGGNINALNCWQFFSDLPNDAAYPKLTTYKGTTVLEFNQESGSETCNQRAVLPIINLPAGKSMSDLQISFRVKDWNDWDENLEVGVMSDPTDTTTFTVLHFVNINSSSKLSPELTYDLSEAPAGKNYIGIFFRDAASSRYPIYIDDVTVNVKPTCTTPITNLAVNATHESAVATWETEATKVLVEYKKSTDDVYTPVTLSNGEKTYTMPNLEENTSYSLRVSSYCSDESIAATASLTFKTKVAPCTNQELPIVFNAADRDLGCMTEVTRWRDPEYAWPQFTPTIKPNMAYTFHQLNHTIYALPAFDTSVYHIQDLQLEIKLQFYDADNYIILGTLDDLNDTTTFDSITSFLSTTPRSTMEFYYSFEDYEGIGKYLAFRTTPSGNTFQIGLENFTLSVRPNCAAVTNLQAEMQDNSSVLLSWENIGATETSSYKVSYRKVNATEWTDTVIASSEIATSITLTGLDATDYEAWVYATCGEEYSNPAKINFNPLCATVTLPHTWIPSQEGISCWTVTNSVMGGLWSDTPSPYINSDGNLQLDWQSERYGGSRIVLPAYDTTGLPINTLQMRVKFTGTCTYSSGKPGLVIAAVDSLDVALEQLDTLATIEITRGAPETEILANFAEYTGEKKYIALTINNVAGGILYISEITLEKIPSCTSYVEEVVVAEADESTATLMITPGEGSTNTNFAISYSPYGKNQWSEPINNPAPFALLQGLNHSTHYEVRVAAMCDNEDVNEHTAWAYAEFTTSCAPADLPFQADFNETANGKLPLCWDTTSAKVSVASTQLRFTARANDFAFTPQLRLEAGKQYGLTFDYNNSNGEGWKEIAAYVLSSADSSAKVSAIGEPLAEADITSEVKTFASVFTVATTGTYNLGIYARSNNVAGYLYVDNLSIKEVTINDVAICEGETYELAEEDIVSEAGSYTRNAKEGNFTTLTITNLTVNPNASTIIDTVVCDVFTYGETDYTESQTIIDSLQTYLGCDSVVTINLTVNYKAETTIDTVVCDLFTYNETEYTQSQVITDSLKTYSGCDSVVTINLTVNNSAQTVIDTAVCSEFVYNETTYTESQTITDNLKTIDGCDSVVTINLTVNMPVEVTIDSTVCGELVIGEETYTESQTIVLDLKTEAGCDSTVTINLTVNQPAETTLDVTACGEYVYNGTTYTESQTIVDNLKTVEGCDSVVTINLTINAIAHTAIEATFAEGSSYNFNGKELTQEGTYYDTLTAENGCDSIVTLTLKKEAGLINAENQVSVSLYPNPAQGDATLSLEGINGGAVITVSDINGRIIYTDNAAQGQTNVTLRSASWAAGTYTVRIVTSDGTVKTKKFIKQ